MAGFKTHIATSTLIGVGYAAAGHSLLGLPLPGCLISGGLCSLAGMLPDLDSDSGVPFRETLALAAAAVPMLLIERMRTLNLSHDAMALVGVPVYLFIRFGLGMVLRKCTVHRGMFHSLPAAFIAALIVYLLYDGHDPTVRVFRAAAIWLGYLSHLVLDEIYSIGWSQGVPRLKKSFGTALKLFGPDAAPTLGTYGLLILLTMLAIKDSPGGLSPILRSPMANQPTSHSVR